MANGDAAAAAGLATFAPTQDIRLGYDNDNIRGDELAAHLTSGTHPASAISSGVFNLARIPVLDAARIPDLDMSKITTGSLPTARVSGYGTGTWAGVVSTTGSIGTSSTLYGAAGISTNGSIVADGNITGITTYVQTNTGRAMYVNSGGLYGIGASARRFKKNIVDAVIDVQEVLKIRVRNFMYKKEFDEDQDVHIGVIAEELIELGLDQFVYFNNQGEADGVAYEKLALALIPVIQNQEQRLQALESKVN
jgi:hypothetical protein